MDNQQTAITGNVLVPIDFSMCCYNAFRYSLQLAAETGRNIVLAHYDKNHFTAQSSEQKTATINRMDQFIQPTNHLRDFDFEELPANVKISFESHSVAQPVDSIVARAEQGDIDLVVMGSKASPSITKKWFGSTSVRVSMNCDRPVFLIPPSVKFTPFERILVANSVDVAEPYPLWQIKGLTEVYQSKVHFVHVDNEDQSANMRFSPWRLAEELMDKEPKVSYPYTIASVNDDDISKGLLSYAQEVDANLVVLINRPERGATKIAHETLTQDIMLRADYPLLILHTEKKDK